MPTYQELTRQSQSGEAASDYVSRNREDVFNKWKKPPSDTEQQKAEAMKAAIKKALDASETLADKNLRVSVHGSYGTNTNVRNNSDIDVQVVFTTYYRNDYSGVPGLTAEDVGLSPTDYTIQQARTDVLAALRIHFGSDRVTDKNKAIHVKESSSHIEADVIACFRHLRYSGGTRSKPRWVEGVRFSPRTGDVITNWPQQNIDNGNQKANATNRRFKKVVRIFKRLNIHMEGSDIAVAGKMSGYFLECLLWNVPNEHFGHNKIDDDVREALRYLYHAVGDDACNEWGETNELTYLFHGSKRTRQDVKDWTAAAWNHCGYGKE